LRLQTAAPLAQTALLSLVEPDPAALLGVLKVRSEEDLPLILWGVPKARDIVAAQGDWGDPEGRMRLCRLDRDVALRLIGKTALNDFAVIQDRSDHRKLVCSQ